MAIFEAEIINEGNKDFKRITKPYDFWVCAYDDTKTIRIMTIYNEEDTNNGAIEGGRVADGDMSWNAFGADTYLNLDAEIKKRGLIYPE